MYMLLSAEFLDAFYDNFLVRILDVLVQDKGTNPRDGKRFVPAPIVGLVVDLMCYLVLHHSFRCKYWALRNQLVPKVCKCVCACALVSVLVCVCVCARKQVCVCMGGWVGGGSIFVCTSYK